MDEFNNENMPNEQQPVNEQPVVESAPVTEKKGMSIAALVLGIVSVVALCAWYVAIPCAIVGLILGILANKSGKNGMATAGIVLSIIGIVFSLIWLLVLGTIIMGAINSGLM